MLFKYFTTPTMKLLLLLASLLIIATPDHAHARILPGIVNSAGDKLDMIITSVYGRRPPSPPPSPIPSRPIVPLTRGNTSPCNHDTTNTCNNNKIKCVRAHGYTIRSPPSPSARAVESLSRDDHYQVDPKSPPPPPQRSPPTIPLRTTTPSALCMPGRPCSAGRLITEI